MEILLNNTFHKVVQVDKLQKLQFINLTNSDKIKFEKWFKELETGNIIKRVDLNILQSGAYSTTAFLIDDSKIYELKGVTPYSIGDSSSDFSLYFDYKRLLKIDFAAFLKTISISEEV